MVLLVRLPEGAELARPHVAEQVEQVQRALDARLGAVLDVVRDVQQLPELRRRPARDVAGDVVGDRHVVELAPTLGRARVERRVARGRHVGVDLLPDSLEVVRGLVERVGLPVEEIEVLRPVRLALEQVVRVEPELLDELAQLDVAGVDQLAAVLGDLPVGEGSADRPATPAAAILRGKSGGARRWLR